MGSITTLLRAARIDRFDATDKLYELLYAELLRTARQQLRRSDYSHVLDTTVVVHESYMRLRKSGVLALEDRQHFLAYAARVMRSVIIDLARGQHAEKRGGRERLLTLRTGIIESTPAGEQNLVALHEALQELAAIDRRLAQVVEMRYFSGMSEQEIADALGIARRTVQRDWEKARLFLSERLQGEDA